MLPTELPLFPLPNVVLLPAAGLPLHIFEPRYRAMVKNALEGERLIGMVMLRPGWEADYAGRPPVYPIGCAGFITNATKLADGRYMILLRGLEKFRILDERTEGDGDERYRVARVDPIPEAATVRRDAVLVEARGRLERLISAQLQQTTHASTLRDISDEDLVNGIAQYFAPVEKQALLECDGLLARCRTLIDLIEMRMMTPGPADPSKTH